MMDIRRQLTDFDRQMLSLAEQVALADACPVDQNRQVEARAGGKSTA